MNATTKKVDLKKLAALRAEKKTLAVRLVQVNAELGEIESMEGGFSELVGMGMVRCTGCGALIDFDDEEACRCRRCGTPTAETETEVRRVIEAEEEADEALYQSDHDNRNNV